MRRIILSRTQRGVSQALSHVFTNSPLMPSILPTIQPVNPLSSPFYDSVGTEVNSWIPIIDATYSYASTLIFYHKEGTIFPDEDQVTLIYHINIGEKLIDTIYVTLLKQEIIYLFDPDTVIIKQG